MSVPHLIATWVLNMQAFVKPHRLRNGTVHFEMALVVKMVSNTTISTMSDADDYLTSPCMAQDTCPLSFKYPTLAKVQIVILYNMCVYIYCYLFTSWCVKCIYV